MTIYVTGIAGLLGSSIANTLKGQCNITGVDIVPIKIPDISYKCFSLFESQKLTQHIEESKPDVIIHTAAAVNVDWCEENPDLAYQINGEVTKNIASICAQNRIKLIYISTDAVFDGSSNQLYTESDKVNPINVYSRTKLEGENFVADCPGGLIVRTNIYGINIQNKNSFGEWVVAALTDGQTIHMFDDIYFSPILVTDLAQILYLSIEKDLSGIFHICGTGAISKFDFGVKLKKEFGLDTGTIIKSTSQCMNFKAQRPKHMGLSNKKICDALNIQIRTPEESIKEFYALTRRAHHQETIGMEKGI